MTIILDGENAWEHFEGGGRPFLRALYGKLSGHPVLRTVTMSEATARSARALKGIFPGSWIDANFFIWIGHVDDVRAWRQLRDARQVFERSAPSVSSEARERARQELLIAEGSDWFWWYGDDHSSAHDLEFDDLFRRHVRNVYQMLGLPIPEELFVTNISTGAEQVSGVPPVGLLDPVLDGKTTSYFEWLAAGSAETDVPLGTMTGSDRHEPLLRQLLFGFDLEQLYRQARSRRLRVADAGRRPPVQRELHGAGRPPPRARPDGQGKLCRSLSTRKRGRLELSRLGKPADGRKRDPRSVGRIPRPRSSTRQPGGVLRVHPQRHGRIGTASRPSIHRDLRPRARVRETELESVTELHGYRAGGLKSYSSRGKRSVLKSVRPARLKSGV